MGRAQHLVGAILEQAEGRSCLRRWAACAPRAPRPTGPGEGSQAARGARGQAEASAPSFTPVTFYAQKFLAKQEQPAARPNLTGPKDLKTKQTTAKQTKPTKPPKKYPF